MILIGYSGHAFVAYSILKTAGINPVAYCDSVEKEFNPFGLNYLGKETGLQAITAIQSQGFFISIGENKIRQKIYSFFLQHAIEPVNAIHPSAIIDESVSIAAHGVMIGAGVCLNVLSTIGTGAICNTGAIIEHECVVGNFAHIGPGAVLCGNVQVGEGSFIGAGAVVRQGITIGRNAVIGAGSVVVKNVGDNEIVVGNPSGILMKKG